MSATRKSLFAVALLLGLAAASATPAAAQSPRGIWVQTNRTEAWTLTVVNLTNQPLALTNSVTASRGQRPPFYGVATCDATTTTSLCFPLGAYQNVTWKSNTGDNKYWSGTLAVLPQGMDPKWTVTLNFTPFSWCGSIPDCGASATWAYVTANYNANPAWNDPAPYNISCSYPGWYNSVYNVMTLSGTDLVATLYAPYVDVGKAPTVDATLVIRERWPHTAFENGYDDSILMPCLRYQDNNGTW